jgi:F0F1-type ATP synthase membrane subunit b/b'
MDSVTTWALEQGSVLVAFMVLLGVGMKWALPKVLDKFSEELGREREFAERIITKQHEEQNLRLNQVISHSERTSAVIDSATQRMAKAVSDQTEAMTKELARTHGVIDRAMKVIEASNG